jgi:glycosyltransferase involved in cell wall biosynthesis
VKTGLTSRSVVQVNYAFDETLDDPDALLSRYATLTGWSEALVDAGVRRSTVVQRFHRAARVARNGVEYVFVEDDVRPAVARADADVVHVNGLAFAARTWRLRRALPSSTAIVVQNHSDTGPMGRAPLQRIVGAIARGAVDAFLFAADEHVDRWRRAGFVGSRQPTYQVMEASTRVAAVERDAARATTGVAGRPALLWVGRLNANKDPLTVLEAFERSVDALPDATLTMIYGADDLLREVRARIEESSVLASRVRLVGPVSHERLPAFYSAADLFVLGSHHEGSGYALIEALACGAVPIVTDIPTFRLLTASGSLGALWSAGDAAACARAIAAVAARKVSDERRRVLDHFARDVSWRAIGRRALAIYDQVLQTRRAAP